MSKALLKLLILAPKLDELGGIANHFSGLEVYLANGFNLRFMPAGKRGGISGIVWAPIDLIAWSLRILCFRPNIILVNTSLQANSILRDSIFMLLAHKFKSKSSALVIFIHGWSLLIEEKIDTKRNSLPKQFYLANKIVVLNTHFKNKLLQWGMNCPIELTTTKVDDRLLAGFRLKYRLNNSNRILFLSRLVRDKGVYIAIDVYKLLREKISNLELLIVGDGPELDQVNKIVKNENLNHIHVLGRLKGEYLINVFQSSEIYLFPSSYGEGMPTSVLEAMAFGLPIIASNNLGIRDILKNYKTGFIIDTLEPIDYANAALKIFNDPELKQRISLNNFNAGKRFYASNVAQQLSRLF